MLLSECVNKEVFANTQLYRMIICKLCTYSLLHCHKMSKKKIKVEESKLLHVICSSIFCLPLVVHTTEYYTLITFFLQSVHWESWLPSLPKFLCIQSTLYLWLFVTEHFFVAHLLYWLFSRSYCKFLAHSSLRSVTYHLQRNDQISHFPLTAVSPVCIQTTLYSMHYIAFFFLRGE